MKLLIYITGKPGLHGHKRREFLWSPPHGVYLYEGKTFSASEFNAAIAQCEKRNHDMNPQVKVEFQDSTEAAPVAPVATITAAHEITAEEAESVLWRLAPKRLKKRPGPPPKAQEMAM